MAGMDPEKLAQALQKHDWMYGSESFSIVIIRHGYLVKEQYAFNVLPHTRFDIWSGTKSFTGTAWAILFGDSREGKLPDRRQVDLDSPAYAFIPEGYPLTDPRKERILFRHLLTMTSGIAGEASGIVGMPTATQHGAFEHALGRVPNRFGHWTDTLVAEPGTHWEYSDPAMCHLALAFAHIMGEGMSTVLADEFSGRSGLRMPVGTSRAAAAFSDRIRTPIPGCISPPANWPVSDTLRCMAASGTASRLYPGGGWKWLQKLPRRSTQITVTPGG